VITFELRNDILLHYNLNLFQDIVLFPKLQSYVLDTQKPDHQRLFDSPIYRLTLTHFLFVVLKVLYGKANEHVEEIW
jgi:hypothetical protein